MTDSAASASHASPPQKWQWPPTDVTGCPAQSNRGPGCPRRDAVAQGEFEPLAATEIAGRRDARADHRFRPVVHAFHQTVVGHRELGVRRGEGRVQRHVDVRVDQPGDDGQAGGVAVVRLRYGRDIADGRDASVRDRQRVGVRVPLRHAIPDTHVAKDRSVHAGIVASPRGRLRARRLVGTIGPLCRLGRPGRENRLAPTPREE